MRRGGESQSAEGRRYDGRPGVVDGRRHDQVGVSGLGGTARRRSKGELEMERKID